MNNTWRRQDRARTFGPVPAAWSNRIVGARSSWGAVPNENLPYETHVDPKATELWDALARARAQYDPRVLAAAEDRVFRFYLPLAWAVADAWAAGVARSVDAGRAAEVGLAEAVLGWQGAGGAGFEAHARVVISAQLRWASTAGARQRRRHQQAGRATPGAVFRSAGMDAEVITDARPA